ncbi:MAG: 50S ribosomal protein L24e [Nitrososphaerales archaeon]
MFTQKKCNFCGKDVPLGRGIMLVRNDGAVHWYCSSKCRKNNLKLRRDPRKLKWTMYYKKGRRQ